MTAKLARRCRARVTRHLDVIDGPQWTAECPACGWEADPTPNQLIARLRATNHTQGEIR